LSTGQLVYRQSGSVFAARFDLTHQEVIDDPVPVLDGVQRTDSAGAQLSISQVGSIVHVSAAATA
jgi:hypothetical protein